GRALLHVLDRAWRHAIRRAPQRAAVRAVRDRPAGRGGSARALASGSGERGAVVKPGEMVIDRALLALRDLIQADGGERMEITIRGDGRVTLYGQNAQGHVMRTVRSDLYPGSAEPWPSQALALVPTWSEP